MKLSEMNTEQLAKCLCEIAGPVSRIGQNPQIEAAMRKRAQGADGQTVIAAANNDENPAELYIPVPEGQRDDRRYGSRCAGRML